MIRFRKLSFLSLTIALIGFAWKSFASDDAVALAAIHAADARWEKAYNAGDLDTVVGLYDENAVIFPPGAAPVHGRAAIRAFFVKDNAEFQKAGGIIVLDTKPAGGVSGDQGWSSGAYVVRLKSGQIVDKGWYFSVSRKVAGKWLYIRDAWNSDTPQASASAPAPAPAKK
jgi:ketosteroid isomerase-like protein